MDIWDTAIGLQQLEQGTPSFFLRTAAARCADDGIGIDTVSRLVEEFYERYPERSETHIHEADRVTINAARLLEEDSFVLSPAEFLSIDRRLFEGVDEMIKEELVTDTERDMPVVFAGEHERMEALSYLIESEKRFDYRLLDPGDPTDAVEKADAAEYLRISRTISHLAGFAADLWQLQMFEGSNTQTAVVFLTRYFRTLGFKIRYSVLADKAVYFKDALVRACYADLPNGIYKDKRWLEAFLHCFLLGEEYPLEEGRLPDEFVEKQKQVFARMKASYGAAYEGAYVRNEEALNRTAFEAAWESGGRGPGIESRGEMAGGEPGDAAGKTPRKTGGTGKSGESGETGTGKGSGKDGAALAVRRSKSYRREQEVLELLTEKPSLTLQELAMQIGCSESTVKRAMQRLKTSNSLERTGAKKNGQWKIRENPK